MPNTVADIMSRTLVTVRPDTPLKEAIQTLATQRISGLPVLDEAGKLVGILSETDLMWQETGASPPAYVMLLDSVIFLENPARYEREIHKALGQTVGEVMTREDLITIAPDRPVREAAQLMHEHHIRRLPVLDGDGKIVGIVTQGDIVRAMANQE
ncbi:MAG: CBS domain-containing protein [Leptolyngbyaceae cyanobacterium bins.59]|nr:CBS domain-containing protein [Leptolyngbyaceae cyanobacterium bins.59]